MKVKIKDDGKRDRRRMPPVEVEFDDPYEFLKAHLAEIQAEVELRLGLPPVSSSRVG